MTVTAARVAAEQLRVALLDHGVQRVSLELQPGVGPKADPWGVAPFVRGMGHHIASYPPGTPGLGLVKRGRTGKSPLQGPLCNGYGGFDLTARIITMGWANHPGEGGPWSVPGWGTVPRNDGRPRIFGWEFEGGYLPYTDEMHDFMACCGAGTLDWLGWLNHREPAPLECWGEHKDPWAPGRKVDRIGYTAASGRARIAAVRTTPTTVIQEDDDMPQAISVQVHPGEEKVIAIPPSGGMVGTPPAFRPGGAAGWGQGFVSFVGDTFDAPREPIKLRAGVLGVKGWRPAFGKDFETVLQPGQRPVLTLAAGDSALVVSARNHPVGVCVEYARA